MKKILLLCAAGMSTSIVVKKMREAAKVKNLDVQIEAQPLETFEENLNNFDIFLLGPQVRFKKADFEKIAIKAGKKVEIINQMDYGMMKGEKILDWALKLI